MSIRVEKEYHDADGAKTIWEKWISWHPGIRPRRMSYEQTVIKYDMVLGRQPKIKEVVVAAQAYLWGTHFLDLEGIQGPARAKYIAYLQERTRQTTDFFDDLWRHKLSALWIELHKVLLTPVRECHGDLTIANCVFDRDFNRVIFLDPGHVRGLKCREMDTSKLYMSADGWDEMCGFNHVDPDIQAPTKAELILLASHYLRALFHSHPKRAIEFAVMRLMEITSLWID